VLAGLFLITGLAWLYLYYLTVRMGMGPMETGQAGTMPMSDMMKLAPWSPTDAVFMFLMWAIMMAGMMMSVAGLPAGA
jgi:predicted metal-binding membrane protein